MNEQIKICAIPEYQICVFIPMGHKLEDVIKAQLKKNGFWKEEVEELEGYLCERSFPKPAEYKKWLIDIQGLAAKIQADCKVCSRNEWLLTLPRKSSVKPEEKPKPKKLDPLSANTNDRISKLEDEVASLKKQLAIASSDLEKELKRLEASDR